MSAQVADRNDAASSDFELRADYIEDSVLENGTVTGDIYDQVHLALVDKTMCLVVGPRGCGKTHMMRYTWLKALEHKTLPLAIYVSFNRYLRLEPFLKTKVNALSYFQTWVLCRILHAMQEAAERLGLKDFSASATIGLKPNDIDALISRLEKAATLTASEEQNANLVSLESVGLAINVLRVAAGRSRCVLLLDDAALTLTPEYLIEFFDVIRSLKSRTVAPKCSVYPGTTEYGPRFHARQEARVIPVWLPVEDSHYLSTMMAIGDKRFGVEGQKISEAARKQLAYAAFGMPRAYLSLLRDNATSSGQQQQALNKSIQQHRDGIFAEYASLATKVPQFKTLVAKGRELFDAIIDVMRTANVDLVDERQLLIGIERSDFSPLTERMVKLLVEAGLLYEHPEVSHGGPDRTYRRFTPHIAALMAVRAFSGRSRGQSATAIVDFLNSRPVKHPIRRKLNTLLSEQSLAQIRIDLPACQKCGTKRVNEDQKFCHNCGAQLSDSSLFSRLMSLAFAQVPGLTPFLRSGMTKQGIKTIGDLLALDDPGTELRKTKYIGVQRSNKILIAVQAYIDEFLT